MLVLQCIVFVFQSIFWDQNGFALAQFQPRIVGGSTASIEDYPYQVSLQLFGSHICGGAILNNDTIITAAHCTKLAKVLIWFVHVQAGTTVIGKGLGQIRGVKEIWHHPGYERVTSDNDIGIVKLKNKLIYGDGVQPISLAAERPVVGTVGMASGWGKIARNRGLTTRLHAIPMPLFDQSQCIELFPRENITDNMFCAGYLHGEGDTCKGDSGGPLVYNGTLFGIVSWGYSCAIKGYPGVFADVSKYRKYVKQYM